MEVETVSAIRNFVKDYFPKEFPMSQLEALERLRERFTEQQILEAMHAACSVDQPHMAYIKEILKSF